MLFNARRRRYGVYPQLAPAPSRGKGKLIGGFLILLIVILGARALYGMFAPSVSGQRVATVLQSTEGEGVRVAISGEKTEQRAENGLRLYDGDRVSTSGGSYATLAFFDASIVRLDEGSTFLLDEVIAGEEASLIALRLERGKVWIETSTGSKVSRTIDTPLARYIVPPRTRVILSLQAASSEGESIAVFATSGPGIEAVLRDSGRPPATVVVGEGQQLTVNPASIVDMKAGRLNAYDARHVIPESLFLSAFYLKSSKQKDVLPIVTGPEEMPVGSEQPLVIDEPQDEAFLRGTTVLVKGHVGPRVTVVRVDGYNAELKDGAFEKEIALPADKEEFSIEVQAEDKDGLVIATEELSLTQDIRPPEPPRITSPGGSGSTVQVQEESFEIVGDASPDTTGIVVNGYQLQKFEPGKPWRYLVDPAIGNVRVGENIYAIVALDRGGNRSIPVKITIVWRAELAPSDTEETPPDNRPALFPGSLRVLAPTSEGSPYTTSEEEVLIEGETHPDTALISINGFTLTKYVAGKTTWNYIANAEFGNYHAGKNLYTIVARNSEGRILDMVRYTIEKQ
jgi:hypothetical protein